MDMRFESILPFFMLLVCSCSEKSEVEKLDEYKTQLRNIYGECNTRQCSDKTIGKARTILTDLEKLVPNSKFYTSAKMAWEKLAEERGYKLEANESRQIASSEKSQSTETGDKPSSSSKAKSKSTSVNRVKSVFANKNEATLKTPIY